MTQSRHIVFFIADGINTVDLFGPLEAFAAAAEMLPGSYSWQLAGPAAAAIRSATGVIIQPDCAIGDAKKADTLIIPGGAGPRTLIPSPDLAGDIRKAGEKARRVASVCTGTFLLARSGLAGDNRVTTHWSHVAGFRNQFPEIPLDPDPLFIQDGKVWSSAGVTAGIDMAMAMIADDVGATIAAAVARELVVYLRRPGNQAQYSEPLHAQSLDAGRLSGVIAWIAENLSATLDIETLAERAGMSPRHFTRVFRQSLGISPAQYVERMRLDEARMMLGSGHGRISQVAAAVGFANPDSFRRAFERQFGIAPSVWRDRFALTAAE